MFNLFPKKKSVDELIEETKPKINIAAEWNELLKEVLQLRHLKEENIKLIEEIAMLKKDIVDYVLEKDDEIENLKKELNHMKAVAEGAISLCDLSDEKNDELEKAKKTIEALKSLPTQGFQDYNPTDFVELSYEQSVKIAEMNAKMEEAQKHPMYPIHWGGYDGAASAHPEEYSKWLNEQKDKATGDPNYEHFKKTGTWPWNGLDSDIHEQAKDLTIEEAIDKVKQKTPWVEEPIDWKGKTTTENLEEKFDRGEDVIDYFKPYHCPCNMCKHAREENAKMLYNNDGSISFRPSWEQAASDLALKVAKLEEKNSIQEAIIKATRGELERAREIHAKLLCQK